MKGRITLLVLVSLTLFLLPGCKSTPPPPAPEIELEGHAAATTDGERIPKQSDHPAPSVLSLSTTAFAEGANIPTKYSCDGENISPPLSWSQPPEATGAFALIMDDPDAPHGVFTHWILFNIPADSRQLPEAVPKDNELSSGARQGLTSFGRAGYGGPCPPAGPSHRYRFTLYALDSTLDLAPGAIKEDLLKVMQGHILAQVTLTGRYQR